MVQHLAPGKQRMQGLLKLMGVRPGRGLVQLVLGASGSTFEC